MRNVSIVAMIKNALLVQGFIAGFCAFGYLDSGLKAVVQGLIALAVLPPLMSFVIKINVSAGIVKPPLPAPRWDRNPQSQSDPLPFFQFGCYYFVAFGLGSAASVPWNGVDALGLAVLGGCGAAAVYIGLRRVRASYSTEDHIRTLQ